MAGSGAGLYLHKSATLDITFVLETIYILLLFLEWGGGSGGGPAAGPGRDVVDLGPLPDQLHALRMLALCRVRKTRGVFRKKIFIYIFFGGREDCLNTTSQKSIKLSVGPERDIFFKSQLDAQRKLCLKTRDVLGRNGWGGG